MEEEAKQLGNAGVLAKPFFVSAFKEKIVAMRDDCFHEAAPKITEPDSLKGLRFLVAEDNDINAEILSELLDIEGAVCEIVENGQLAVARFSETEPGTFDAILMDVQMPVMNGYEAARAIRALGRADGEHIPIIAMTANAFAEDVRDALEAGMNAHVAKPIDMRLLKEAMDHIEREE